MKKLMIAAFAIAFAVVAQAATYNWQCKSGWATATDMDEDSTLVGSSIYAFDANIYTIAAITAGIQADKASYLDNALTNGGSPISGTVKADGSFAFSGGKDLTAVDNAAKMYAVIFAEDASSKEFFYIADMGTKTITSAHDGGAAVAFNIEELYTGAVGSTGWNATAAIPEPTSGLLLLLGMAGLALKRKRA